MKLEDELLGYVTGPEGRYSLNFYGKEELAAAVCGPVHEVRPGALISTIPESHEVHREPARDAADARTKLQVWMREQGWPGGRC